MEKRSINILAITAVFMWLLSNNFRMFENFSLRKIPLNIERIRNTTIRSATNPIYAQPSHIWDIFLKIRSKKGRIGFVNGRKTLWGEAVATKKPQGFVVLPRWWSVKKTKPLKIIKGMIVWKRKKKR